MRTLAALGWPLACVLVAGCRGTNPTLTWNNEGRYDGVIVERAMHVDKYCVDFTELTTLPGSATQYVDNAPLRTGACYRIRGFVDTPAGRQYSGYSETKTRK